jgi:hypothetical protein
MAKEKKYPSQDTNVSMSFEARDAARKIQLHMSVRAGKVLTMSEALIEAAKLLEEDK